MSARDSHNVARVSAPSFSQEALWVLCQLIADEPVYNESNVFRLKGTIDVAALTKALDEIVRRHESLRTRFRIVDGAPMQEILAELEVPLEIVDLSAVAEAEREAHALRRARDDVRAPFDLEQGPLIRVRLLRVTQDEHWFVLAMHHIIRDGTSSAVFARELSAFYSAYRSGRPSPLPQLATQYADFASWQREWMRGKEAQDQLAYWKQALADLPTLELPTDRPRPAVPRYRGGRVAFTLGEDLTSKLKDLRRQEGTTLFTTLLAAFQVLLYRYSGQEDIAVGVPIGGRHRSELKDLIGYFVNVLVLRGNLSGEPTFRQYLAQVRQRTQEAYAHQDVPFAKVVEALASTRDPSRNPLFQVSLVKGTEPDERPQLEGLVVEDMDIRGPETVKFDLSFSVAEEHGTIGVVIGYATDLFDAVTIERMAAHWHVLLAAIAADPEQRISHLPLLTPAERRQLLPPASAAAREAPRRGCLHERFEAQVRHTPEATALAFEGERLSYAELNARANRLAHHLRSLGVGPEVLVAIVMERSLELVVGLLAILKAGGAYVPLDPGYPVARVAFMLTDTLAPVLLTQQHLLGRLPEYTGGTVCLDRDDASIAAQPASNPTSGATEENLAYVIYTSGSTGQPKGTLVTHHNVVRLFVATGRYFGFDEHDVWSGFHSFAFDFSVWEMWGALLYGGRLVLVPYLVSRDPEQFRALLIREGVTVLSQTPSAFRSLMAFDAKRSDSDKPALRFVIFGGEALDFTSLRPWFERHGDVKPRLVNMYGITETTVHATYRPVTRADLDATGSMIGAPLPDLEILLLDRHLQPVPIGIPGEIFVAGAGVARGYLNRPDLTAERFIADPFASDPASRLYRTGDLARRTSGNDLLYLGRIDQQVKIRGYRVELGEIESALSRHPKIQQTVVVADQGDAHDAVRLIAYVVPSGSQVASDAVRGIPLGSGLITELRAHLKERLPDFMVPSAFMGVDRIPLTTNGKIDRKRLPAPKRANFAADDAPSTSPPDGIEEQVAAIFGQALGLDRVETNGDFFELGGDSLLAVQTLSRIEAVFGTTISIRSFFSGPTVAQVARELEAQRGSTSFHRTPSAVAEVGRNPRTAASEETTGAADTFPLSFAQQQLWLLDRLLEGRPVYNVWTAVRLTGPLEVHALQRALQEIVRRHEALRTTFAAENGAPVQVIAPEMKLVLEVDDLGALPATDREAEARRRTFEATSQPFDLERGPLFRARLLRIGESEHWLVLALHHIVTDGLSSGVMRRELSQLYDAFREGRPSSLPELPVQYADYSVWQREWLRGDLLKEQLAYWKQALAELPVLELPTDRPRPTLASYAGRRVRIELGEGLTGGLKELVRREGATLFMTLLAALQVLLYRYSGQEDIAVGVPTAGRQRPELQGLIGYFVNMLVLRGDLSGEPSFRAYLARVRERAVAAYAHQDVPFAKLVEELRPRRDASRNPLFQVSFAMQNTPPRELDLAGLDAARIEVDRHTAKFDLNLSMTERRGNLDVGIEYATDLFDATTIERMAAHFQVLLEAIVADPEQRISHLPLLTQAERQQLAAEWSATAAAYPRDSSVHALFEEQVRRAPQTTAVVFEGQHLTYAELNARANRLAHYLRTVGVGPEVPVAIAMERSLELVVGLLGILKAGGAYVPLDPSYPAARLAFMLSDTGARVLLTQRGLLGKLRSYAGRTLCLDRDDPSLAAQPDNDPSPGATTQNLAYIIYTSGSTDEPKGVMIEHRSVVNYLSWIGRAFPLTGNDRVLQKTPISVDASVEEIFFPLTSGAVLVIAGADPHRAMSDMVKVLQAEKITVLQVVPSLLATLLEQDALQRCASVRLILCGGEALSPELVRRLRDRSDAELVNLYGPTEATISSTFWQSRAELPRTTVPIGNAISNTRVMVVDRAGQLVPEGVAGELWIGGAGLARGYLDRPALTAERFVADPWSADAQARVYKTGDRVRRLPDGNLEFLGRRDQQVKLRGFRVELGEIEAVVRQHEAIQDAVVSASEDGPGDKRLLAYIVPARGRSVRADELRAFLLRKLPDYMVPTAFLTLEALPLGAGGKIDRKLLPAFTPEFELATRSHVSPRNAVEVQLMRIWERILDVSPIGMQDNFFALGGDSLAAVRVIDRVSQLFGRQLPPDILWYQEGTIEALARALVDDSGPPVWSGAVPIKASGGRTPLFCPHIVGGHLFFYDNLARHLDDDQPLYGLPARGFDGKAAPDSQIEVMATHCIHAMKRVQSSGPYSLAGYCSGGLIAFEMARQLHAAGERVELLALCDTLGPGFHPLELARTAWNFVRLKNVRLVQQRLYRFVLQNLGLSRLRKFGTVTEAHYWAFLSYRPQPYPGHAVLFRAANADDSRSLSLGWEKLARAGIEICVIPCGHSAMVKEPMVRVLADKLETYLGHVARRSPDRADPAAVLSEAETIRGT